MGAAPTLRGMEGAPRLRVQVVEPTPRQKALPAGVLFFEDFESYEVSSAPYPVPAPPLIVHDVDGLDPHPRVSWIPGSWIVRDDYVITGGKVAMSNSYFTVMEPADHWLVLPPITLTAESRIRWRATAYDADYAEGYEVRVSPGGGAAVADFTDVILQVPDENEAWTPRSASLAPYTGQTVRVAIRHTQLDGYLLLIDDISIEEAHPRDAAVGEVGWPKYTQVPAFLGQRVPLTVAVDNRGTLPLSNVVVSAQTLRDGVPVGSQTAPSIAAIAPGASEQIALSLRVQAEGEHELRTTVSAGEADEWAGNNTGMPGRKIIGTTDTLARDNGVMASWGGLHVAGDNELGQRFDIEAPAEVLGASFVVHIAEDNYGDPELRPGYPLDVRLRAWDADAQQPGEEVARAVVEVPEDIQVGQRRELHAWFEPGTLAPGTSFVLTVEEPSLTLLGLGMSHTANFEPGTLWMKTDVLGWARLDLGMSAWTSPFMLRARLAPAPAMDVFADGFEDG